MVQVSIIMNVRNGAATLREALDSVFAQMFKDWEIIFWDDGSTDESVAVAASYRDERIRIFKSTERVSLGPARQLAINQSTGKWLAFLDQDDIWTPDKLSEQMKLTDDPRVGIIYGRTVLFGSGLRERDYDHRHEFCPLPQGDIFEALFTDACYFSMSSAMLRRSAVMEVGEVPAEIACTPDYYLFAGIARSYRARAIERVICRYRIHGKNMSRANAGKIQEEILWLVEHWSAALPPALLRRRRQVHNTVLAVQEFSRVRSFPNGVVRLLRAGSIPYLMSRPVARLYRGIRRRICQPYYLATRTSDEQIRWDEKRDAGISVPDESSMPVVPLVSPGQKHTTIPISVKVLGTSVTACSFVGAQDLLAMLVERHRAAYVSPATAYGVTLALEDPNYQQILNRAEYVTSDGMPIVWMLRWMGSQAERVHHDDLFLACCDRFRDWRHFLVGGRLGQPDQVAAALRQRFPGINIVGTHATPERPVPKPQTQAILEEIKATDPSIVWVGMGTPAQDYWMHCAAGYAGVPMVGVGSVFDLLAGRTKPAPEWMKRSGLQWAFRFCQEPRRLASRYIYYNSRFVLACSCQLARRAFDRYAARIMRVPTEHRG